jgi:hypothetical protein
VASHCGLLNACTDRGIQRVGIRALRQESERVASVETAVACSRLAFRIRRSGTVRAHNGPPWDSNGHGAQLNFDRVSNEHCYAISRTHTAAGGQPRSAVLSTTCPVPLAPLGAGTEVMQVAATAAAAPGIGAGLDVVTGLSTPAAAPDPRTRRTVVVPGAAFATRHPSRTFPCRSACHADVRPAQELTCGDRDALDELPAARTGVRWASRLCRVAM